MSVPDRQLITGALIAMLATSTSKQVGDHEAPPDPVVPYSVVHCIPGGDYWGAPLAAPDAQADFVYQVDSVGLKRSQVEWMADRVRRCLLARSSTGAFQVTITNPAGWRIADRRPSGGPGGVDPQGVRPNKVFAVAERFVLSVVPA